MLTLYHLKKRGRVLANRSFLCEEEEGLIEHLLVHCSKARVMWDLLLAIVGVTWVFPKLVREILLSWCEAFVRKRRNKAWMAAYFAFIK